MVYLASSLACLPGCSLHNDVALLCMTPLSPRLATSSARHVTLLLTLLTLLIA